MIPVCDDLGINSINKTNHCFCSASSMSLLATMGFALNWINVAMITLIVLMKAMKTIVKKFK